MQFAPGKGRKLSDGFAGGGQRKGRRPVEVPRTEWRMPPGNLASPRQVKWFGIRGGVDVDGKRMRGFAHGWLGLDAPRRAIVRVRGKSMESTSPDGCSILFNRDQRVQRERESYAVIRYRGPVIKRAARRGGESVTPPAKTGSGAGATAAGRRRFSVSGAAGPNQVADASESVGHHFGCPDPSSPCPRGSQEDRAAPA